MRQPLHLFLVAVLGMGAPLACMLHPDQAAAADDRPKTTKAKSKATPAPRAPNARPPDARPELPRPAPATPSRPQRPSAVTPAPVRPPVPRPPPSDAARREPVRVQPDVIGQDPTLRRPQQSHSTVNRAQVRDERPPAGSIRPYDRSARSTPGTPTPATRPDRSSDHRYARPDYRYVRQVRSVPHPPPGARYYAPRYTNWWVHPYYRHYHVSTVVVGLPFYVHPWAAWWVPPARPGWQWVSGYWSSGHWHPGYWRPAGVVRMYRNVPYAWVDGWWQGDLYVEGYWRRPDRGPEWVWVDGTYMEDGAYVPGYWRPAKPGPAGYVWEAGFYDGDTWVEGFWRPRLQQGYVWVPGYYDEDGVYNMGFWEPEGDRPGFVWIPGWFDGTNWVNGYWVEDREYREADVDHWQPPEGWNAGWDRAPAAESDTDELPLALPAD